MTALGCRARGVSDDETTELIALHCAIKTALLLAEVSDVRRDMERGAILPMI